MGNELDKTIKAKEDEAETSSFIFLNSILNL